MLVKYSLAWIWFENFQFHVPECSYLFLDLESLQPLFLFNKLSVSFHFFFFFPFGRPIRWNSVLSMMFHRFYKLSSFFFIVFLFFSSDWIISNGLCLSSLSLSSTWSSILSKLSLVLFSPVVIFSSSKICLVLFYIFSLLILFCSYCCTDLIKLFAGDFVAFLTSLRTIF